MYSFSVPSAHKAINAPGSHFHFILNTFLVSAPIFFPQLHPMIGSKSFNFSGYSTPNNNSNNMSNSTGNISYRARGIGHSNYNIHSFDHDSTSKAASYLEPVQNNFHHQKLHSPIEKNENSGFPNSIGEYGMGKLLGRGAFGSVYEVTEIRHKTPLNEFKYAIKIVKTQNYKLL